MVEVHTIFFMTFHRCSHTQPPPQLPSPFITTSEVLMLKRNRSTRDQDCKRDVIVPVAAARWPSVRIVEVIAAHYASEAVVLRQSVRYGLFVLARGLVGDYVACPAQLGLL